MRRGTSPRTSQTPGATGSIVAAPGARESFRRPAPGSAGVLRSPVATGLEPVGAADHVEHDLVRARADAVEAHVAPHALHAVLLHVAGAAVDLDALVGHLDRDP